MTYNKELVVTSSLFFVPLYVLHNNNIYVFWVLQDLIILQGIASMAFWWNPVKGSFTHKIDRVLARISISSVISYKMYNSPTTMFVLNIMIMLLFFKMSNMYSRQVWCSKPHIICHAFAHLYAHNAIYLAFL